MSEIDEEPSPAPSLMRKFVRFALLASIGLVLALLVLVLARPEMLLFFPSKVLANTPDEAGWDHERVELETEDGETIVGWMVPAEPGGALEGLGWVVLYCHGNGGNIGDRMSVLAGLRELGLAVLIFDYRGYGESSGRATVNGTRLDVIAAWRHLVEVRGYAPDEVVLWGRSLGGAVAIDQAARATRVEMPPAALVVESSFTSTVDIGEELYPWLPIKLFARKIDYPSRELIAEVDAPILLAHSPDDELIPASHGQRLREAAEASGAVVRFIELAGGHNEGHLAGHGHGPAIVEFLRMASSGRPRGDR